MKINLQLSRNIPSKKTKKNKKKAQEKKNQNT